MDRRTRMYDLEYPSPEVAATPDRGPTLIVALQGYADAGHAIESSAHHLLQALEHMPVASFHSDELIDYRSRRPTATIAENQLADMEDARLELRVFRDTAGTPFLLLAGPEPDMRWNAFTEAVVGLVDRFHVDKTVCLYAAPMAVPHTRPLVVTAHGNTPEMLQQHFTMGATIRVPGSAALMLEHRLQQSGHKVGGFTAHVPHYVASSEFPEATLKLLRAVERAAGLDLPLESLELDVERTAAQLNEQTVESQEIQKVLKILEAQYDQDLERYVARSEQSALATDSTMPSGDELGAEFERFLQSLDSRALDSGMMDIDQDPPHHSDDEPQEDRN